jgi:flagellar biosynthesis protein FlhB
VIKKIKRAIGLKYRSYEDDAPVVNVKGVDVSAEEVVKIAKRFGIPVVEKNELAKSLYSYHVDEVINESLYHAVACLLHEISENSNR